MKVYTGTFRHCGDSDMEIVVATTVERIEQELIRLMKEYVEWINRRRYGRNPDRL